MQHKTITPETDVITFNGNIGLFSDEVVELMINEGFDHFNTVSLAQLVLTSNKKTPTELLTEYAQKNENLIISFPNAHEFFSKSFNVLFLDPKDTPCDSVIDKNQYNCIFILDGKHSHKEVVYSITVAYGYWTLGRSPDKIIA